MTNERLSAKACEVCGCPSNHDTHMLPTYREHNYDPACCVEYLTAGNQQMSRVLNRLHAKGGIVAYSEGEWLVIGGEDEL